MERSVSAAMHCPAAHRFSGSHKLGLCWEKLPRSSAPKLPWSCVKLLVLRPLVL